MPKISQSAQPSAHPIPRFAFFLFLILFNVACVYSAGGGNTMVLLQASL